MNKVLFIDIPHPFLERQLTAHGFICDLQPDSSREELMESLPDCCGVVIKSRFFLDAAFLECGPNLKFVARVGAGVEHIDTDYAAGRDIACITSPEGNRDALAEHAVGMLLNLLNNLNRADRQLRDNIWQREPNRGVELMNKTVGIIGFGHMGAAFARRLSGFGVRVLAYDKYRSGFSQDHVAEVDLATLQAKSDIISLHVPLTDETTYMVNRQFIDALAKPVYLINTARGMVVDTRALVDGLKYGKIAGAALDVLEYEDISFEELKPADFPAPFHYLTSCDNVILSPHIAGWTHESSRRHAEVLAEKIIAYCSAQ